MKEALDKSIRAIGEARPLTEEEFEARIKEQWEEFCIWIDRLEPPEPANPEPDPKYLTSQAVMKGYRKKLLEIQYINNHTWDQIHTTEFYLIPKLKSRGIIKEVPEEIQFQIDKKRRIYGKFASDQQDKLNNIRFIGALNEIKKSVKKKGGKDEG